MNKITSIHLNGKAFQLEEAAYDDLQEYLQRSEAKLADNPDKTEIMTDLEQAIADKCSARLGNGRDVVTETEMADILLQMGPVEPVGEESSDQPQPGANSQGGTAAGAKRPYAIPDGAMIAGVCNGLAAYFNLDVNLVRLAVVLLTVFTGGGVVVAYIILALILPVARTNEQIAQARGTSLTAQEIVDNSKARLQEIGTQVQKNDAVKKLLWVVLAIICFAVLGSIIASILGAANFFIGPWHWSF